MTKDMKRTLALVALNGRAMDLHREFVDSGDAELAALMRQIGEQVTIALRIVVRGKAHEQAQAVERFEVES